MSAPHEIENLTAKAFFPRLGEPLPKVFKAKCTDGVELHCFLHKACPKATRGQTSSQTLVYFHGNGEVVGNILRRSDMKGLPFLFDAFCVLGIDIFLAEYRGYGTSGGSPSIDALMSDVGPVHEALNVPQESIIVMGRCPGLDH
ncbi:unnamed protein product [Polarella glacialis]|uniref:Serine aminopeptidase S33 domain-containing protein n=2 Tax=Polarella glacialis TaxID=89957 RepID=A0A813EUI7_POLGL|nr:unnamed protein product [Polarella glacialis]